MAPYHYRLSGLRIDSPLLLPGLQEEEAGSFPPDVTFELVPPSTGSDEATPHGPHRFSFVVPRVGLYTITDGCRIKLECSEACSADDVRLFLLGSAFGALFHQRRLLPLHASAVCIDGRGVAVLGRTGAGKSTLAACLLGRGHDLIADDVCVLDEMGFGIAVSPGVCRLRLSEQASTLIPDWTLSKPLGHYASGKYEVSVARRISRKVPLGHLFVLEECSENKPILFEKKQADSALGLLLEHIYRSEFSMYMGCMGETFRLSAATVNTIPLSIIRRPRAFSRLHDVARQIEKETNSA